MPSLQKGPEKQCDEDDCPCGGVGRIRKKVSRWYHVCVGDDNVVHQATTQHVSNCELCGDPVNWKRKREGRSLIKIRKSGAPSTSHRASATKVRGGQTGVAVAADGGTESQARVTTKTIYTELAVRIKLNSNQLLARSARWATIAEEGASAHCDDHSVTIRTNENVHFRLMRGLHKAASIVTEDVLCLTIQYSDGCALFRYQGEVVESFAIKFHTPRDALEAEVAMRIRLQALNAGSDAEPRCTKSTTPWNARIPPSDLLSVLLDPLLESEVQLAMVSLKAENYSDDMRTYLASHEFEQLVGEVAAVLQRTRALAPI